MAAAYSPGSELGGKERQAVEIIHLQGPILHDLLSPARSSLLDYPEPTKAVPPTRNRFGKQELVVSMSDTNNKMKRMGSVAFF